MINKLPRELIQYLQKFLDDPTLKAFSSVNKSFFKNSHSEKILRKIHLIGKNIQQLKVDLDKIKMTLNGQLQYQGNFLYHFILDDMNGFQKSDDAIIRDVVKLNKEFAIVRLQIVKTNVYVLKHLPNDDLIASNDER